MIAYTGELCIKLFLTQLRLQPHVQLTQGRNVGFSLGCFGVSQLALGEGLIMSRLHDLKINLNCDNET